MCVLSAFSALARPRKLAGACLLRSPMPRPRALRLDVPQAVPLTRAVFEDVSMAYLFFRVDGEDFESVLALSLCRPIARVQLAHVNARTMCPCLRAAWTVYIWELQWQAGIPLLDPCMDCGHPTAHICDTCSASVCWTCSGCLCEQP